MAKTNEQFDQHFKEKLDGHREKPSALAWDRLESQLPKKSNPKLGVWWAIAASVTALLVAGYSFWPSEDAIPTEKLVAEKTEIPAKPQTQTEPDTSVISPEIIESKEETEPVTSKNLPEKKVETAPKTKPAPAPIQSQTPQNLIAQSEIKSSESPVAVPLPELKAEELPTAMPELKAPEMERTVAQASTTTEEEPLYRVSIYSNGIKKGEPTDKNLITELGKTVGHVEGLLGKVDEGFAEIQDRKDNLFAGGLAIKKDRAER
ncbi:hypothetical protein [Algoriphagus terrigena]|uniref:hypothetical protein n=1 Tax=Algoriphagus terrigena TaxID=344884 RepID=UPI0003FE7C92|nr:hypothetical protein [Algoriphagus terrigena]